MLVSGAAGQAKGSNVLAAQVGHRLCFGLPCAVGREGRDAFTDLFGDLVDPSN